jgi:hypothetical protein
MSVDHLNDMNNISQSAGRMIEALKALFKESGLPYAVAIHLDMDNYDFQFEDFGSEEALRMHLSGDNETSCISNPSVHYAWGVLPEFNQMGLPEALVIETTAIAQVTQLLWAFKESGFSTCFNEILLDLSLRGRRLALDGQSEAAHNWFSLVAEDFLSPSERQSADHPSEVGL